MEDSELTKDERLTYRRVLISCLAASAAETTAHAIPRMVGNRRSYVKITWLFLFIMFLAVFIWQALRFVQKLSDMPETTTIQQDSVAMIFPDMYLCPQPIMSGSFGHFINNDTISEVNRHIDAITQKFNFTPQTDKETETFIRILLATLPYKTLSQNFGHQFHQTIFYDMFSDSAALELGSNATGSTFTFNSPRSLNCFLFNLSDSRRAFMKDAWNHLNLYLFYDTPLAGIFPDNPALKTVPYALIKEGIGYPLWDIENGMSYKSGIAMRLLLVPPGQYPTDSAATIFLQPGNEYYIGLEMSKMEMDDGIQCDQSPPRARIMNPYTGNIDEYEYSNDLCWIEFKEALRYQNVSCVDPSAPQLVSFSNCTKCWDATPFLNASAPERRRFLQASLGMKSNHFPYDLNAVQTSCNLRRPCEQYTYSAKTYWSNWPNFNGYQDAILNRMFMGIATQKMKLMSNYSFPAYTVLSKLFSDIMTNNTPDASVRLAEFASQMMAKVTIKTARIVGPTVVISRSYTFLEFISDVGGIIGLYLGASLLTLFELLEFLHGVLVSLKFCRLQEKSSSCSAKTQGGKAKEGFHPAGNRDLDKKRGGVQLHVTELD